MAHNQKHYDTDYKIQSVNLAKEIGLSKAARELSVSPSTLNGWVKATREGRLITAPGSQTPGDACLSLKRLQCSESKIRNLAGKISVSRKKMNFLRRQALFSPRAVGSQQGHQIKVPGPEN